ncbi:methyltransferase type 11 [Maritimibacter sp. 55A14]|uniref:class I SAM-dependent methyltransferase n=1 Tax=Maritimibacter sp. 55A14 TaxID=2174844 RepID=UPI000D6095F9|nr:class I SAM-dependent methyltransferase [Maritimibacter sp. 55A14]PWE32444.1 methyltransferase type 11 [Maritimibacter sp. 55A14]
MIESHNIDAARAWGHAGANYDFISFGLNDGLSHAVQCLWPLPGEHILDVATGTGRTARLVAEQGADVTGIDIAEGLLEPARAMSAHLAPRVAFRQADAEALPFDDAQFDGAISTYGVMFAGKPDRAAAELARVIKPGGRMVLTTWYDDPEDYIPAFFAMVGKYADAPPPEVSPMVWGNADWLTRTFGADFDLDLSERITTLYAPDADTLWQKYRKGFGPMDLAASELDPDRLAAFQQDFRDLHAPYATGRGLKIDRKAMLVQGIRKG